MDMTDVAQDLAAFWMPFTANQTFKKAPRLLSEAKGMYYKTPDGREILDGTAGLWCVNAGHCRDEIVEAVQDQAARMDFAPTFQMGHPMAFETANRLAAIMPPGLNRIFFTNSGSESVDTALKIALAYHRARGEADAHPHHRPRARLPRRRLRRHVASAAFPATARSFGDAWLPGVDHLRHTHDLARNAFSKGQPAHGARIRRRAGAPDRAARRVEHRRGDRRADGRFDRRAGAAQGLPRNACAPCATSTASC